MTIEGYAAVPTWVLRESNLSGHAILVYASLASRAGFRSIHPGQQTIAAEARCGERKVRDALKELEAAGVVERVARRYKGGQRAQDGYVLHSGIQPDADAGELPASGAGCENQPADSDQTNRQIRANAPYIEKEKEEIQKVPTIRRDVEELLDLLDSEILRNGFKKLPARNAGNVNAMRLLLDRDGETVDSVKAVILWCQSDQFWFPNIRSASKLREKFETLRAQMIRGRGRNQPQSAASRVLGIDLGDSSSAPVNGRQIGSPSIIGEIAQGRF